MPEIDCIEDIPANFLAYYEIVVRLDSCLCPYVYLSIRIQPEFEPSCFCLPMQMENLLAGRTMKDDSQQTKSTEDKYVARVCDVKERNSRYVRPFYPEEGDLPK